MVSKAKQEAIARYNKQNVRRVTVIFSPLDRDIQEYLEKLLREDYERQRGSEG